MIKKGLAAFADSRRRLWTSPPQSQPQSGLRLDPAASEHGLVLVCGRGLYSLLGSSGRHAGITGNALANSRRLYA